MSGREFRILLASMKKSADRKGPFIFYERGGAAGGGGGHSKKNWLERGGQPKKNEGKWGGGSDEKIRLKIG